jgi:hypothetical protein
MVSQEIVHEQLGRLGFKPHGWGRAEVNELPNILLPEEEIHDLVNGFYEGGFALLVATDVRLLLIDKKPLNYLTVEDLRFDQINELDYSHRLMGAYITISSGSKTLKFRSYNQPRLRKVINHVQHSMAELKKQQNSHQEDQKTHLEQINQQLQAYLIAQHHQQEQMRQHLQTQAITVPAAAIEPLKPSPELADFLYAQSLLAEYRAQNGKLPVETVATEQAPIPASPPVIEQVAAASNATELYNEATQEVFGKYVQQHADSAETATPTSDAAALIISQDQQQKALPDGSYDVHPLRVIWGKLPMLLHSRKFGSPLFHAHNRSKAATASE